MANVTSPRTFLPYGRPVLDDVDIEAVVEVLQGDWLTNGPMVETFEVALAQECGSNFSVTCSSGTAGLHLALMALGLGEGDAIIVPSMTFLATANAGRYVGARVIFTDVDPETGLMRPSDFIEALDRSRDRSVKAVLPVHYAGQTVDIASIQKIASDHGIWVVEDACHAIGTKYAVDRDYVPVGACRHSDLAVFSFHPVKTIATGEGGAVTTNDSALATRLRILRNHAMIRDADLFRNTDLAFDKTGAPQPWYYEMRELGFNYRLSDIHCALGLSQLKRLDSLIKRRRELAERYDAHLQALVPLVRPLARTQGCLPAWHLCVVLIDFETAGLERATLMRGLKEKGIGSQVHYVPVHRQPYYRELCPEIDLPGADVFHMRTLSLPLFTGMSEDDVDYVVAVLQEILENARP